MTLARQARLVFAFVFFSVGLTESPFRMWTLRPKRSQHFASMHLGFDSTRKNP